MSKEFIQVPRGKKYTVSGEFKLVSDKNIPIYFGVTPFTADGKVISYTSVFTASRALAELAKDIKAGDKSMILKGADSWKFHKHGFFAFNAKADRSDLPNLDLSPAPIINEITVNEDGTVEIPFKKPFAKAYAAGTPVRQHFAGSSYIYAGNSSKKGFYYVRWYNSMLDCVMGGFVSIAYGHPALIVQKDKLRPDQIEYMERKCKETRETKDPQIRW